MCPSADKKSTGVRRTSSGSTPSPWIASTKKKTPRARQSSPSASRSCRKPLANSTVYAIVADGRPVPLVARLYALYYKLDTFIDAFTLLSHEGSLHSEEGDRRETATTRFDRSTRSPSACWLAEN